MLTQLRGVEGRAPPILPAGSAARNLIQVWQQPLCESERADASGTQAVLDKAHSGGVITSELGHHALTVFRRGVVAQQEEEGHRPNVPVAVIERGEQWLDGLFRGYGGEHAQAVRALLD